MGIAKNILEGRLNNTYGIEVEFGTHNNQMLSFTHIEVCYLHTIGGKKEDGWKIETDSDYTLELVSPILHFNTQLDARKFENELMQFLEVEVRNGILLVNLMTKLKRFIGKDFTFPMNVWTYVGDRPEDDSSDLLEISWITKEEMEHALTWKNWDEDTDLERVLASKQILNDRKYRGVEAEMEQVLVTRSRKHGGLPSSQLNLPLALWEFTSYETFYKRDKAWKRLLEENTSEEDYFTKKLQQLRDSYPQLSQDKTWEAKYFHKDYIESKIDEKTPFWHRYWLWLETFYICACHVTLQGNEGYNYDISYYTDAINLIVDSTNYYSTTKAKKKLTDLHLVINELYRNVFFVSDTTAQIIYLIINKVVSGTFSEMSETLQKQAQEKIMNMKGDMSMDQIMASIPDNQFMQFHYALKDLTSLWFKAPLMDVINTEWNEPIKQKEIKDAILKITKLKKTA
jgi:hypothetical protein